MSMLSISIEPSAISTAPKRELANDDFPLPLRPQIPICEEKKRARVEQTPKRNQNLTLQLHNKPFTCELCDY